jgi:hypothetical protein
MYGAKAGRQDEFTLKIDNVPTKLQKTVLKMHVRAVLGRCTYSIQRAADVDSLFEIQPSVCLLK